MEGRKKGSRSRLSFDHDEDDEERQEFEEATTAPRDKNNNKDIVKSSKKVSNPIDTNPSLVTQSDTF